MRKKRRRGGRRERERAGDADIWLCCFHSTENTTLPLREVMERTFLRKRRQISSK
jgi:hypothetical protein